MISKFKLFIENESGATAIEYAMIAIMVSVALIGGATTSGQVLNNSFESLAENF